MKLSVILVAGAQALGIACGNCGLKLENLIYNNWDESKDERFNFLSNNWDQFVHGIQSVSRLDLFCKFVKCFRLIRKYCDQFSILAIPWSASILWSASKNL